MKLNERAHHHVGVGGRHAELSAGGAAWVLQLTIMGLAAMIGGALSRGPLKPIKISESPPITGQCPEYRDFLTCNSARGRSLGMLLEQ